MKISEVMNKAIVVDDNMNLKQAAKIMSTRNIGSLIVMRKDKIIGIVTDHDIIANIDNIGKKVSNFMSKTVVSIEKDDSIEHAAEIMAQKKIKRLPVVSKGNLVGIITATDVVAHIDEIEEDFFFE